MHEAGLAQPGTMAAVLGLDDDQVEVACRRADRTSGSPTTTPRARSSSPGRRRASPRRPAHAKELGAKKVMPLQVSGAFHTPFMTAARNRLRAAIAEADPRDTEVPVVSNVDALPHHEGKEWASLLSAQLSSPGALEAVPAGRSRTSASPTTPSSGPAACSPAWPSARSPTPARSPSPPPRSSTSSSSGSARSRRRRRDRVEGEHLFASERLVVSPAAGVFARAAGIADGSIIDVGTVLGHVGEREVRSPFAGTLQSYIAVETERVTARQPIAWLRTS